MSPGVVALHYGVLSLTAVLTAIGTYATLKTLVTGIEAHVHGMFGCHSP